MVYILDNQRTNNSINNRSRMKYLLTILSFIALTAQAQVKINSRGNIVPTGTHPGIDSILYVRGLPDTIAKFRLSPQKTTIQLASGGSALTLTSASDVFRTKQDSYTKTETNQLLTASFAGVATTTTNPGTPVANVYYRASGTGSYTNFLQSAATPITVSISDGIVDLVYTTSTGYWTKVAVGLDYRVDTAYDLSNNGLYREIATLVSQDVPFASSTFRDTTSTFSGWLTNIGSPQNFDVVVMRIGARDIPITSIRYGLFVGNDNGQKLTDRLIPVNIPAYTYKDVYFYLDSTIKNVLDSNLAFGYQCNQLCNRFGVLSNTYFPLTDYPIAKYKTSGIQSSLTFTTVTGSSIQYSNWFKAGLTGVFATEQIKNKILISVDSLLQDKFDAAFDTAFRNSYIEDYYAVETTQTIDTPTFRAVATDISGWGSPIGMPQNFNGLRFKVKARASGDTATTVRCRLTIGDKSGTLLQEKTFTVSIAPGANERITWVFDSTIVNAASNKIFFSYATDAITDIYGVSGEQPFPEVDGYGQTVYFTNGTITGTGINSAGRYRVWVETGNFIPFIGITSDYAQYLTEKVVPENLTITDTARASIVTSADSLFKARFDNALDTAFANTYVRDDYTNETTPIFDNPSFLPVAIDISGWGGPIGMPQNFNGLRFKVKSRAGGATTTTVRCRLTIGNKDGALLQTKTFSVNIPAGSNETISWVFDSTIVNAASNKLFFSYATNTITDIYGVSGQEPFPESAGYGQTVYYVGGSTAGNGANSSGRYRVWVETGTFTPFIGITDEYAEYLTTRIGLVVNEPQTPTVTANLNSYLYAVEGKELNVYFDNFISADYGRADLTFDITCTKGKQLERRWTYTPVASDSGSTTFSITIKYKGQDLITKSATLITKAASAGTGDSIKINAWGDSHLSSGQYLTAIVNESMTNPAITFVGTQGTGTKKHEGRGGYKYVDYATVGRTLYKIYMSGVVTTPSIGSTYTNNSATFQTIEVNITSGSGYISFLRVGGSNTPTASGTLTRASGSGDLTITFTSYDVTSGNPMWNGTYVDPAAYYSGLSVTMTSDDLVFFNLGINDIFSSAAGLSTIKTYIDTLIAAFHRDIPGIKIGIGVIVPATGNQDGFGENYNNGQTWAGYMENRKLLNSMLLANFDNATMRANGVYTIPFNVNLDAVYNVQKSTVAANARNSTDTVTKYTNSVHPAQSGYDQMADTLYAFIKSFF